MMNRGDNEPSAFVKAGRLDSFKKGGTKRGAGAAKLHKNERIQAPKRKESKRSKRRGGGR